MYKLKTNYKTVSSENNLLLAFNEIQRLMIKLYWKFCIFFIVQGKKNYNENLELQNLGLDIFI